VLDKLKTGMGDNESTRYVVIHSDLQTDAGGTQMRLAVAQQAHALIQEHKPNHVYLAVDYNEGDSGGKCTLVDLSQHLLKPDSSLKLPVLVLDSNAFRQSLSEAGFADLKQRNKAKEVVILEYVLYGGNLEELKAACRDHAKGDASHWITWQGKLRAVLRSATPKLRTRSAGSMGGRPESASPFLLPEAMLKKSVNANGEVGYTMGSSQSTSASASPVMISDLVSSSAGSSSSAVTLKMLHESNSRGSLLDLRGRGSIDAGDIKPHSLARALSSPATGCVMQSAIASSYSFSPFFSGDSPSQNSTGYPSASPEYPELRQLASQSHEMGRSPSESLSEYPAMDLQTPTVVEDEEERKLDGLVSMYEKVMSRREVVEGGSSSPVLAEAVMDAPVFILPAPKPLNVAGRPVSLPSALDQSGAAASAPPFLSMSRFRRQPRVHPVAQVCEEEASDFSPVMGRQ
jgi:hypothetical protein